MKKRILSLLLACGMAAAVFSSALTVSAHEVKENQTGAEVSAEESGDELYYGDIKYTVQSDGTVKITDYKEPYFKYFEVNVPGTIDGRKVTAIGDEAFAGCSYMTNITLPDSITSIGYEAFHLCTTLTSFTIPKNVTYIGARAFFGCTRLVSVNIPYGVTYIGDYAFYVCRNLTSVTIPNSVTEIGRDVFDNCESLKSVSLSNRLVSIPLCAFAYCTSLESITIPKSVKAIDWASFGTCTSLKKITIPKNVEKIEGGAFGGCTSLKSATFLNRNFEFGDDPFSGLSLTLYGYKGSTTESAVNRYNSSFDRLYSNQPKLTFAALPEPTEIGDLDGDNIITSADALIVLRESVGLEDLEESTRKLADVDGDGYITSADSLAVLRHSIGLKDKGILITL